MPLAGKSLRSSLRDEAGHAIALPPGRVLDIAEVLTALEHAHGHGFVHRDIKPENILIDKAGRVRLADFGIARALPKAEFTAFTQLTQTNQVIGTMAYIAPEQQEAGGRVDERTDLYSFGVVLYECLAGHRPMGRFEGPSERLPVNERQKRLWDNFVLPLLERDPDKRPRSARVVLDALTRMRSRLVESSAARPSRIAPSATRRGPSGIANVRRGRRRSRRVERRTRAPASCRTRARGYRTAAESTVAWPQALPRPGRADVRRRLCGVRQMDGHLAFVWRFLLLLVMFGGGLIGLGSIGFLFMIPAVILCYAMVCALIPVCPDPVYRPRPLNAFLPRRVSVCLFGVCTMIARATKTPPFIWQLVFGDHRCRSAVGPAISSSASCCRGRMPKPMRPASVN